MQNRVHIEGQSKFKGAGDDRSGVPVEDPSLATILIHWDGMRITRQDRTQPFSSVTDR